MSYPGDFLYRGTECTFMGKVRLVPLFLGVPRAFLAKNARGPL